MDTLPELLSEAVEGETVIDTIDIGGGDTIAVAHGATYVYRSDGLLKDESVERFDHAIERLSVRTKRRKSSVRLESIDAEESFTVPSKIERDVISAVLEGVLRTDGTIESDESVLAQYRFSELTLVITDVRLFEHVGGTVWDSEFEAVAYADLSGLDFERGSVATQVVIETDSRRRRVKVPNEHAGSVKRDIQDAVFAFYDVESLKDLRTEIADPDAEDESDSEESAIIDSEPNGRTGAGIDDGGGSETDDSFVSAGWSSATNEEPATNDDIGNRQVKAASSGERERSNSESRGATEASEHPELEALSARVDELAEQIDAQTELIESQGELIEQLVDELRRGR